MVKKSFPNIAIIIPAYNEASTIRAITEAALFFTDKVIVIDDGSVDTTASQIRHLPVVVLRNPVNQGKGISLMRGFQYSQQWDIQAVITIDADTQHDPQDIPRFIHTMQKHPHHIIIGARHYRSKKIPKLRRFTKKIADFVISRAAGLHISDTQSGYRLYPVDFLQDCLPQLHAKGFALESEIIIQASRRGYTPISIPINSHYLKGSRQSHYKPIIDTIKITGVVLREILFQRRLK